VAPWFATAFVITALASIGLPGTSGFVGEFLALLGAFETHPVMAGVATLGVIFAAYYMLPMVQSMFFNALDKPENRSFPDLSPREIAIMAPMCALMIWIGWHPTPILERMEPSVRAVLERVEAASATVEARAGGPGAAPDGPLGTPKGAPGVPDAAPAGGAGADDDRGEVELTGDDS
jgi:NADH-quinone oxidoreductase subunit M